MALPADGAPFADAASLTAVASDLWSHSLTASPWRRGGSRKKKHAPQEPATFSTTNSPAAARGQAKTSPARTRQGPPLSQFDEPKRSNRSLAWASPLSSRWRRPREQPQPPKLWSQPLARAGRPSLRAQVTRPCPEQVWCRWGRCRPRGAHAASFNSRAFCLTFLASVSPWARVGM